MCDLHCSARCQWPSRNILDMMCIWEHTSPKSLPKPDIVSLLNICQTDRQKPISNCIILYIRTVFFLSSNVDLVVLSSGEGSILCFGEALSFRSIPAPSLCPIQLVSALLVFCCINFFAFPIAEQSIFSFCLWRRFSLYLYILHTTHRITNHHHRYTSTQSLPLSHVPHHIQNNICDPITHTMASNRGLLQQSQSDQVSDQSRDPSLSWDTSNTFRWLWPFLGVTFIISVP